MQNKSQYNPSLADKVKIYCIEGGGLPRVLRIIAAVCMGLRIENKEEYAYYKAAADELAKLADKLERINKNAKY